MHHLMRTYIPMTLLIVLSLPACTTMQTTYFRASYQELAKMDNPSPPKDAMPGFAMVNDMKASARDMYGEGYTLLGYSQFVSPLFPSLAQDYSTKWGKAVGASFVMLETPRQGESNLHYYLVTYWAPVDTRQFTFGAYMQDLPPELLKRLGPDLNVVLVQQAVQGTAAGDAGILADDALLAVNGIDILSTQQFSYMVNSMAGQEILVTVSRAGTVMDVPVQLGAKAAEATPGPPATYHEAPWLATAPTDWSGLSAAAISQAVMENNRRIEEQRQREYERAQLEAMRHQAYLDSQRASSSSMTSTSRRGVTTRGTPPAGIDMERLKEEGRKNWEQWQEDYLRNTK